MTIKGIDVSSYQPERYSTRGLDFVIIKITEGTSYTNPKWVAQRKTARDAGLVTGFYHFVRPGSMTAQANYFLSKINLVAGDFLVLDWEDPGVSNADKDAWIKHVQKKAPGHKVLLYCNVDYWLNRDRTSFAGDGLWIAQYNGKPGKPSIQAPWVIHQYTSTPVDTNLAKFSTRDAMRKWAGGKSTGKPKPKYEPFPGADFFMSGGKPALGKKSEIFTEMGKRLVAEGCSRYKVGPGPVLGQADIDSYEAWQRKCGFRGKDATWPPGKTTWDRLKVPNT
ncbi:GH25 family lysozyme [Streptomyces albus]|uniref:GH25 family lysozyme n=1 Tax=Streptomyces albus TaxID=1888 RepID=UPI002A2DE821|nr:hypothetical protein TPA0909_32240 [Streptomyces albus]